MITWHILCTLHLISIYQISILLGAVLLSLKICFTFSHVFERNEELSPIYCLYTCSKNWYLVGSIISEEEVDERRMRMPEKVSGGKKETINVVS